LWFFYAREAASETSVKQRIGKYELARYLTRLSFKKIAQQFAIEGIKKQQQFKELLLSLLYFMLGFSLFQDDRPKGGPSCLGFSLFQDDRPKGGPSCLGFSLFQDDRPKGGPSCLGFSLFKDDRPKVGPSPLILS